MKCAALEQLHPFDIVNLGKCSTFEEQLHFDSSDHQFYKEKMSCSGANGGAPSLSYLIGTDFIPPLKLTSSVFTKPNTLVSANFMLNLQSFSSK